ncbi:hypothetical protein AAFM71_11250 [Chromobacterium violaceum]|uniref:hypothetical protein n=1 Tax=Chromobacterium violaceum TaxID=536 RepID=UPI0012D2FDAF|nr:hypothetical protein [Chromobacterium violaceum]
MSKPDASQLLAALAGTGESKAARFRALLPQINAAIERGVRHARIIEALAADGLHMSHVEFRNALYRERRREEGKKAPHAQATENTPASTASMPITTTPDTKTTPQSIRSNRFDYGKFRDGKTKW